MARRNLYPSPMESYSAVSILPALTESERQAFNCRHVEEQDGFAGWTRKLRDRIKLEAKKYAEVSKAVQRNEARRLRMEGRTGSPAPSHWNVGAVLDPRRWCEDCQGCRRHRAGCPLIVMDGPYVGGYPNDGTRPVRQSFKKLHKPAPHWQPVHHRQHRQAVARRWHAFRDMWTRIGLDYLARMLNAKGGPVRPPRRTSADL